MFAQELPPGRAEGPSKRELAAWVPTAGNLLEWLLIDTGVAMPAQLRVRQAHVATMEHIMNRHVTLGLAMLASALFGAVAVNGLNAQSKPPGAYAVVDIAEMTDANLFREQLLPKVTPATLSAFGGQYLVRSENAISIDGTPPKRFVVIGFDSMDKAKAWSTAPAQKEVDAIRMKATKSRQFLVEGFSN